MVMFDQNLRPLKDKLLRPLGFLGRYIHPNLISLAAFLLGLLSCGAILTGQFTMALALWGGNRILDGLDGAVARYSGRQSDFGGYLDIMLDFVLYGAIPLALGYQLEQMLPAAVLLGIFYVNSASWMYLSGLLEKNNSRDSSTSTSLIMPKGLIEGLETILFFSLFLLFPPYFPHLAYLMAAGTTVGIIQRLWWGWRNL